MPTHTGPRGDCLERDDIVTQLVNYNVSALTEVEPNTSGEDFLKKQSPSAQSCIGDYKLVVCGTHTHTHTHTHKHTPTPLLHK